MMKMKPEWKARWVAALRSGEYNQGQGVLRTDAGQFCCLGVLCHLVDPSRWGSEPSFSYYRNCSVYRYEGFSGYPSGLVREISGLTSSEESELAHMNDAGSSFAEIANYIEQHL